MQDFVQNQHRRSEEAIEVASFYHYSPNWNYRLVVNGAAAAANLGVRSVSGGDLNGAMLLFREALVAVKTAFAGDKRESTSSVSQDLIDRAIQRVAQAEQYGVAPTVSSFTSLSFGSTLCDPSTVKSADMFPSSGIVFDHLFSIHAPSSRPDTNACYYFCSDHDVDTSLFSAVIIYNMAVTTHRMAIFESVRERRDSLRQRTSTLYDMCHQLLANTSQQMERGACASPSATVEITCIGRALFDLMCMAIVNNKAELCAETVDRQLSLVLMDQLVDLAASVREQSYGDDSLNRTVQTAVQFFVANAQQACLCNHCAAPAA